MKKKWYCIALSLLLVVFMVGTAFASTGTNWRSPYTPYKCTYAMTDYSWSISNVKWNSESVSWYNACSYRPAWEAETRSIPDPTYTGPGSQPPLFDYSDYWDRYNGVISVSSNLPNAYGEMDADDFSVGCNNAKNLVAETNYSASLQLYRKDPSIYPIPSDFRYRFESEVGEWMLYDALPVYYQVHHEPQDEKRINTSYSWNDPTSTPINAVGGVQTTMAAVEEEISVVAIGEYDSSSIAKADEKLQQAVAQSEEQAYRALVVFDEYLSPDDVAEQFENVEAVYCWVPGETGRSIIAVKDGDVEASILEHADFLEEEDVSDELTEIAQQYKNGNIGIFAVRVSGTAQELANSRELSSVKAVELHADVQEGVVTAVSGNTKIIEVPEKPDKDFGVY